MLAAFSKGKLACTLAMQASQEEQERADAAVAAFMFGVSEQADRQAGSLQPPEAASSSTAPGDVVTPEDILAQMDTRSREQAARGQGCVNQSSASIVDWPGNPGEDCRACTNAMPCADACLLLGPCLQSGV